MSGTSTTSPAGRESPSRRRARVAARTRLDFWFDAIILAGYTVAYSYGWTGVVIHEWLGIGLGIALLLHLTLHWDWVVRTTRRLLRPRGQDKLIWLVNLALLFAMTLCIASGIAISRVALPELGIYTMQSPFWFRLHALTAEVTVGLVPIHVALRWRWIAGVGRRLLAWRPGRQPR
ncbi:MAG: DUF4405 domain-containing protein [Streptosporangiaceae bacterium]